MNPAPMQPGLSADQAARERIRTSLDESLIVEASAGTGKTSELVRRIVAILATGRAKIENIAAVTFTHKAAGEMKLRLREALDQERHTEDPARRDALEQALARLEEASIGTIHSFCAQILRERPVEAQVDPGFEELGEQETRRVFQKAFRSWLERRLDQDSPGLRRAFARLAWREAWDDSPALEQLQWAGWKLVEWRDYPALWRRDPFAREEEIGTLVRMTRDLADLSSRPRRVNDNLYLDLQPVRDLSGWIEQSEKSSPRDYDALESRLLRLGRDLSRKSRKGSGEYGGGVAREELVSRRDELVKWIFEFRNRADADLAAQLREEMTGLLEEYRDRKHRQGKLDFVDLLVYVRNLLRDQLPVRLYLQHRFTHLFIDEFQDTDPLQVEILMYLAENDPGGKLFLVGDPKQSIYKFRRADLTLYRRVREELRQQGVGLVSLTRSFRSVRNIQQFVNAAFETEMAGDVDDGHADWAPLEKDREDEPGRPSVLVLPVPHPYQQVRLSKTAVDRSLPDAIAAFIRWLIQGEGKAWGFSARDIAVLFRRRTQNSADLTREYARALEARGVPHLLAGSKSFHRREEVETLRIALTAIEWPEDELSVFAALKGSLFAIPDESLFLHRHKHGRLYPFAKDASDFPVVQEALDLLADLHRQRNRRPFAATVNALLEATRAAAGFLLRPGGQQVLANVARVAELARGFELSGGISFRGFVEELTAQAEKEEAAEAPVLEEDSDGVRLLTVHGAKGLEFRVVILADLTANIASREPDQYVDSRAGLAATRLLRCAPWELIDHAPQESARERAEGVRVAYVAATRARDLLVIPAVGDEPFPDGGWLGPLNKAVYPSRLNWRRSMPAEGCPAFGQSSVISRPPEYDGRDEISVRPGLIEPEAGSHQVVWWDPFKLKLGEELSRSSWFESLKDDGGASLAAYQSWKSEREKLIRDASRTEFNVFLASQSKEAPPDAVEVSFISVAPASRAASGRRFGALVHSVLRDIALDASGAALRQSATLNSRILGAPDHEAEGAFEAVERALAHPILAQARAAERCHREYPLVLPLEDGRVLEGVIDLTFFDSGKWTVIDFKTDADVGPRREQYHRQLQWYAHALARLTGHPATAVLLSL